MEMETTDELRISSLLLPDDVALAVLNLGYCPDCHSGEQFLQGPEGGLTSNIKCKRCGVIFNYCPPCTMMPRGFVERP